MTNAGGCPDSVATTGEQRLSPPRQELDTRN
jgi:hypothetical protein